MIKGSAHELAYYYPFISVNNRPPHPPPPTPNSLLILLSREALDFWQCGKNNFKEAQTLNVNFSEEALLVTPPSANKATCYLPVKTRKRGKNPVCVC
jgi:hypothetical protein